MSDAAAAPVRLGRYVLYDEIAAGGMARVHLGRQEGAVGFSRTVAVKRLHPHLAKDPEFVAMFLDEARLAARIRHPNVVTTLDVVATAGEVFLVMEYVEGVSLSDLIKAARREGGEMPPAMAAHIAAGALSGLHAAHEARDERGESLELVHRDVSPQNIIVGTDGVARVLDFGVAKAAGRLQTTEEGRIKGKMAYMSPEQLSSSGVTRRTDVFAAGVVLWEALTGRRLFQGADPAEIVGKVLGLEIPAPSHYAPAVSAELDAVVLRALARDPAARFPTALEMAEALERAGGLLASREVGDWVRAHAGSAVRDRALRVAEIERSASGISRADAMEQSLGSSGQVSAHTTVGGDGTDRSQVGTALSRAPSSLAPRRARWPYAAGAAIALVLGVVALVAGRAEPPAASAAGEALPTPQQPEPAAIAPAPEAPAREAPAPEAALTGAPDAGSAPTVATAPKAAPPKTTRKPAASAKKPASRDSLYGRD
ncbi:MAG: serine/threonine protein kinase [Polyangiaceae bacterium]|nr:serine/threonine protein kinase [Polyangiaceae bacterium]